MKKARHFWHGIIFVAAIAAIAAITMLLWNMLIPAIIGWQAINYWQAAGLLILCRLLFGGMFGGLRHHHSGMHGHGHSLRSHIHKRMKEMTFEQKREYIRKYMAGEEKDE
ncbi:MAG: hypothetical protein LBU44_05490 [Mediterranea sp.]|jgi:hypothetical protein|nr:hypothetical protein [Mediterranea sp.]